MEGVLPGAKASPRLANGCVCWYEYDTFALGLLLALTDQDGEAADIQSTDTVKVTFFDCRNEIVQEFTFTGVTGNHIEMEFTDEVSRKFQRGRYHYDILYTHADKTTLVRGNTAIVE